MNAVNRVPRIKLNFLPANWQAREFFGLGDKLLTNIRGLMYPRIVQ